MKRQVTPPDKIRSDQIRSITETTNVVSVCAELSASAHSTPPPKKPAVDSEFSEKQKPASKPIETPPEVFCEMPCAGKQQKYLVTRQYVAEMSGLYPGIDVEAETLKAKAWLINNPKKIKTFGGIPRYLGNWYSREQNRMPARASPVIRAPAENTEPAPEPIFQKPEKPPPEWILAQEIIRKKLGDDQFDTWFRPIACIGKTNGSLELVVPTKSFQTCLLDNYFPLMISSTGVKNIQIHIGRIA
jgi:hypothetical protein